MIEGTLERLSPQGWFSGWLRESTASNPRNVQLRREGEILAQAVAQEFRPDLLAGGHGHGHYGFTAQLRTDLPPGLCVVELYLPKSDQAIRTRIMVPPLAPRPPASVEALLARPAIWQVEHVLAHPACLNLAAARAAMGDSRFIDVTYHWVLQRWPSDAEAAVWARALASELSPEAFLCELLASRERRDLGTALASPWEADFPYTGVLMQPSPA